MNEEKGEEVADSLAMGWGFAKEWQAWAAWNEAMWNRTQKRSPK